MISEYINRRDVQNILSKYYPEAGPTTEQILHNINRDVKSIPNAEVVTWEQLKKAWAISTTDVAPVVHGEWIDGLDIPKEERERHPYVYLHGEKHCSVCFKEAYFDTDYGQQLFDYCPNCGAKMDGGTNDESD